MSGAKGENLLQQRRHFDAVRVAVRMGTSSISRAGPLSNDWGRGRRVASQLWLVALLISREAARAVLPVPQESDFDHRLRRVVQAKQSQRLCSVAGRHKKGRFPLWSAAFLMRRETLVVAPVFKVCGKKKGVLSSAGQRLR